MAIAHGEHSAVRDAPYAWGARHERAGLEARTGVSAAFPAEADSPRRARRMAAATLRRWGHGEALVADVSLVVSELASNAVRHAGSSFSVALQMQGLLLRVAVEDRAPLADAVTDTGMTPQPPHGLCVVDSLAASWGIEPTRTGKVVWAQLTHAAPLT
jgi:anti-sigma regulatory factor (Ser/Thr protein kinase)